MVPLPQFATTSLPAIILNSFQQTTLMLNTVSIAFQIDVSSVANFRKWFSPQNRETRASICCFKPFFSLSTRRDRKNAFDVKVKCENFFFFSFFFVLLYNTRLRLIVDWKLLSQLVEILEGQKCKETSHRFRGTTLRDLPGRTAKCDWVVRLANNHWLLAPNFKLYFGFDVKCRNASLLQLHLVGPVAILLSCSSCTQHCHR